jgi:hypothetical protein
MLLDDLPRRLAEVDLLATTFFHVEEVRRRARSAGATRGGSRREDSRGKGSLGDYSRGEDSRGDDSSGQGLRGDDSRGDSLRGQDLRSGGLRRKDTRGDDSRRGDSRAIEVIGLMALPDFRTLDEVARLPSARRVALVCATREGVTSKARSLASVGLRPPRLQTATLDDPGGLARVLWEAEVVLASPRVIERMREMIPRSARVVPFASVLSDGAAFLLNERIAAWRARKGSPPGRARKGSPHDRARRASSGGEPGRKPDGNRGRDVEVPA